MGNKSDSHSASLCEEVDPSDGLTDSVPCKEPVVAIERYSDKDHHTLPVCEKHRYLVRELYEDFNGSCVIHEPWQNIDLHRDTFQPDVSIQTSVRRLRRKPKELIDVETTAIKMNDYPSFMAIANHVGHDKRGDKTCVRDRKGNQVIEEIEELAKEWAMELPSMSARLRERKGAHQIWG